jgi:hypothetical protein
MTNIWDSIDKLGWRGSIEKCFKENWPDHCPNKSPFIIKSKYGNYCKYYSSCLRIRKKKLPVIDLPKMQSE